MIKHHKQAKYIMKQHQHCVPLLRRLKSLPVYTGFEDDGHICLKKNILIAFFTHISLLKSIVEYVNTSYKTKL